MCLCGDHFGDVHEWKQWLLCLHQTVYHNEAGAIWRSWKRVRKILNQIQGSHWNKLKCVYGEDWGKAEQWTWRDLPVDHPIFPGRSSLQHTLLDVYSAVLFACAALQASVCFWTCLHLSLFALSVDMPGCAHVPMCVHSPLGFTFACSQHVGFVLAWRGVLHCSGVITTLKY